MNRQHRRRQNAKAGPARSATPSAAGDSERLDAAIRHHQAGRLAEAEAGYRHILQRQPDHADALHLLGIVVQQAGQGEPAAALIRRALAIRPAFPEAWNSLGNILRADNRLTEAVAAYREAVALKADYAEAHGNLAIALQDRGEPAAAEAAYRHALALRPDYGAVHHHLGLLLQGQGRLAEAEASLRRAVARMPGHAGAAHALANTLQILGRLKGAVRFHRQALALRPDYAEAHNNLGVALLESGPIADAQACHLRAVALAPGYADAWTNLGRVLQRRDRAEAAVACHRHAAALNPALAEAHSNLGIALRDLLRLDEAAASLRHALTLRPGYAEALTNLGTVREAQGRYDRAEVLYHRALAAAPDLAEPHLNLALLLLGTGRLAEGWAEYHWRFAARRLPANRGDLNAPAWAGEDLAGRRLLVWSEQGIGDTLMFGSCLADAIARAGHVVVECDPRLVPLFARSFPTATIRAEGARAEGAGLPGPDRQDHDLHTPAGSLPRWLRPEPAAFPPSAPSPAGYLVPDPERVAFWRARLAALGDGPKVGIGWRSGLAASVRRLQYTDLDQWEPVLSVPGMRFVTLQYDGREEEMAAAERRFGVSIARWPDLDLRDDLEGAAALTAALDLVITAPTSVGEMAGALGVPVWRFARGGDWTMLGTDRRPWFPSMRLFSVAQGQELTEALAAIGRELRAQPPGRTSA